jgi:hypothetical protein
MANTTLQNIIASLQGSGLLTSGQINGGITDGLAPPYINVYDYQHTVDYQTQGIANKEAGSPAYSLLEAAFKVLIVHTGCDAAEQLAANVEAFLNCNLSITPHAIGIFQTSYKSSPMDVQLYQWGVEIEFKLTESYSG